VRLAGFLSDLVGDGELADVAQERTDRQRAQPPAREPQLLADPNGSMATRRVCFSV
jgi:hypothetical protein